MNEKTVIALFAMGCLTLLEIFALYKGVDGQIFATVISALSGIVGYAYAKRKAS